MNKSLKCRTSDKGNEDTEITICLNNVGVYPSDSRDNLARYRFLPFKPDNLTPLIEREWTSPLWWGMATHRPQQVTY